MKIDSKERRRPRWRDGCLVALTFGVGLTLTACQALPPALGTALTGFGQDVLAAAAQNFAPQYAASMQNLFFAMAETATGVPFTQQVNGAASYDTYGAGVDADGTYTEGAYAEAGDDPGYDAGYDSGHAPGYEDAGYPAGDYQTGVPEAHQPGVEGAIALEVAVLAQQLTADGQVRLRPVEDGETLYDGRGNPARGDKIKILFAANCDCYVYVIGIDATGYVARIFPDGNPGTALVQPGAQYLVPGGTTWWGLDDHRGVEQIYFVASHRRRPDIEDLLAQLAGQRPALPAEFRAVREPAIVPTRGLVQVQAAAPTVVPSEFGPAQPVSPTSFRSTVADADLVITRWFRHE